MPLRAMGRFVHEAMAVDPRSGFVYLTEDMRTTRHRRAGGAPGFYRFMPARAGRPPAGGRLQMLRGEGPAQLRDRARGRRSAPSCRWAG